ncbi:ankyrin repeat with 8 ankyrin repeats domain protein [Orientia chuto str. Dubai]|uniref:Ankyrin repeat with 8 ankyrin repeats domain protein n=2 Tax=Candidatus Orientia mediorientalis TaxID=911112 RepID=A0A0F3MIE9_9RICK|nr:ankyrin repeat with 8 ankyrin repeats domain protein [Orientia chuto str. Dubai]
MLLERGADASIVNKTGDTPLNVAMDRNRSTNEQADLLKLLVHHIVKSEHAGNKASDLEGCIKNRALIQQSDILMTHRQVSEKEIEELKNIKVGSNKNMFSAFLI